MSSLTIKNSESFAQAILSLRSLQTELYFDAVILPVDADVARRDHHLALDTRVRRGLEFELGVSRHRSVKHMVDAATNSGAVQPATIAMMDSPRLRGNAARRRRWSARRLGRCGRRRGACGSGTQIRRRRT